jgi:3-hydroxyacyl-[acyl-carrier-protein] dehydratase
VRFHLIDRIDAYEPFRSVRGRKLTSVGEDLWDGADPVLLPPLVLEALCQTASWLIVASTEGRRRAALLQLGSVAFHGDVRPGDVVELTGTVDSMTDEMAVLSGTATVGGVAVLEATEIMCVLMAADELQDAAQTERMRRLLTREGE